MASLRFFKSSENFILGGALKNGTGGGAPALSEATGYPMSNAKQHDRYTPWQVASGAGTPLNFDFDLGGDIEAYAIGLHGFRLLSGTMGTLTIQRASVAQGYNPAAWAGDTFGTVSGATLGTSGVTANRDVVTIQTAGKTTRYIRFSFAHTTAVWSVGKLLAVGAPTIDASENYEQGGVETDLRYQLVTTGPTGHPLIEDLGDQGRAWQVERFASTTAIKDGLITLGQESRPFSIIDENDKLFEARLAGGAVPATRVFNTVWRVGLDLVRLP